MGPGGGLQTGSSWRWILAKVAEGMRSPCRARKDWKNWGLQCEARGQGRLQGRQAPTQARAGSSRRDGGGAGSGVGTPANTGSDQVITNDTARCWLCPGPAAVPWGRELPESEFTDFTPIPPPRPPAQCRGSSSDLRGVHLCGVHYGSGCLGRKGRQGRRGAGPRALRPGLAAVSCPLTSMRIL